MKSRSTESLKALQAYRGIAAVSVLLFHATVLFADPHYFGHAPISIFWAGAAGVPFFFVLSGYIIARSHDPDHHGVTHGFNFLLKRGLRLYPMLWLVLLPLIPVTYILGEHQITPGYILASFFALPMPQSPLLAVEWTLQHEVLFYLVYAAILFVPKLRLPLLGALALTSIVEPFLPLRSFPTSFFCDPSHVLFVIGVLLVAIGEMSSIRTLSIALGVGIALFCITYAVALYNHITLLPYFTEWPYGIASALIIFASVRLEQMQKLRVPEWMVKLGDASYVLYLVHFPLLSFELRVLRPLYRAFHLPLIVLYGVSVLGAAFVSLVVHEILERKFLAIMAKRIYRRFALT